MLVDRRTLANALKVLTKIAAKNVQPILNTVLLETADGLLHLTATDLNQRLTIAVPAEGQIKTCLPANLLARLVKPGKRGDDQQVVFNQGEKQVSMVIDGLTTRLSPTDPTTFPAASQQDGIHLATWPAMALQQILNHVLPAVSTDHPTRQNLCSRLCGSIYPITNASDFTVTD